MCMKHEIGHVSNVCVISLVGLDEIPQAWSDLLSFAVLSFLAFSMPSMMPQEWRSELYAICRFQATKLHLLKLLDWRKSSKNPTNKHEITINMMESVMFTKTPIEKSQCSILPQGFSMFLHQQQAQGKTNGPCSGPAFGTKLRRVRITRVRLNEVHESILSRFF